MVAPGAGVPHAASAGGFAEDLLAWYDREGRKDLPWQRDRTPYRVWVSEVMLQQTRVGTVIPYFERFVARFPDVAALAAAPLDEVLALWSGLGYYARARHLHRAAAQVMAQHQGELPENPEVLAVLPGIGRSTAGAVLALARDQRRPILDGNVKRVLARYHRVPGWPGAGPAQRTLWTLAEAHTPANRVADYTQAIMDLGATVCVRRRPACGRCPVAGGCAARAAGEADRYPEPRPARVLPVRATRFVIARDRAGAVLLERRPPAGVWASLWAFPECTPEAPLADWCRRRLGAAPARTVEWPAFRHTFSHFHLDVSPVLVELEDPAVAVLEGRETVWYKPGDAAPGGLAAPVSALLERLAAQQEGEDE
ncbi:MAG: A/G-specific adenine glycosylase [Gammaproteobacteria bacterium]|nr:A/G-specific adenine glycosylase [Gammaproteobacteria bacterium]